MISISGSGHRRDLRSMVRAMAGQVTDPYVAYLLYDSFTAAADTDLPDHTPEKGGPWSAGAGVFGVVAATDDVQTGNSGVYATTDIGENNFDATVYMAGGGGADGAVGFVYRYVDATHHFILFLAIDNDAVWLYKNDGVWTLVDSSALVMAPGTYYKVRVLVTPAGVYTVWVDNVLQFTGTDNAHAASTKIGLYNSAAAPAKWDDLTVA